MDKKKEFEEIFRSSFADSAERCRWFFDRVVDDPSEIILGESSETKAQAALLMQPYALLYRGALLRTAYISCVATRPEQRSRGLASGVLRMALAQARERGLCACSLIPAESHLFHFYRKRGFAPVFYTDEDRYTPVHRFDDSTGVPAEPTAALLHGLEMRHGCGIVHAASDFTEIVADTRLDGGAHILARTDGTGKTAMLFANESDTEVRVKCLMADTPALAESVLADLRQAVGSKALTVHTPPADGSAAHLRPFGMLRITDPMPLLQALAASAPSLHTTIALTDSIIAANSGIYTIGGGEVSLTPLDPGRHDLDIDIEVLTAILFSSHATGSLFGLPARRPYMALMLE
ncbi:MAG: GNAT family N-acetyltransferase [Muribaculaceae bacterium]|nr:GNAT family N-acetyltransferase [Muribaculaceae bacterium]